MTLIEFLTDRLDEDEGRALSGECECRDHDPTRLPGCPDRIAAEVAAKRAILTSEVAIIDHADETKRRYPKQWTGEGPAVWYLQHLAAVYADHPDYREEWKP